MHSKDNQKRPPDIHKLHRIFEFSTDWPQNIGRIFRFSFESLRMQSKDNQKGHLIFTNSTGYSNFQQIGHRILAGYSETPQDIPIFNR